MDVGGLAMHQIAQNAFPAEVQGQHFVISIAAVFKHHAVAARLFRGVDQLPALLQRHGGRHFDGRVLAALHRIDRHRRVPQPRRADVDQIDLAGFAQRAPRVARPEIAFRRGQPFVGQGLDLPRHPVFEQIADRPDLDTGNAREPVDRARPAVSDADEADTDLLQRFSAETDHAFAPLRHQS